VIDRQIAFAMAEMPFAGGVGAITSATQYPGRPRCSGGSTSGMVETPVLCASTPVSSMARDGAHSGEL
jgi:hypothetical protein